MKIAVEGCAHGELETIYETIGNIEKEEGYKVDLLLCCGDFESTRNMKDLKCMAGPENYRQMCSFYKYHSGEKVAPVLTIFIGGNHEASNYLQELPYGGWVAPNIYYLGYAGVVTFKGLRIGGWSGIFHRITYLRGHFEVLPYDDHTKKSVYYYRQQEFIRLSQLTGIIDVMMSHDWPAGVYNFADTSQLIAAKPHFLKQIQYNSLGSPPSFQLLNKLRPMHWFSGHMHCKFTADIPHEGHDQTTKFLALDKCLPGRSFLEIVEVDAKDESCGNDLHYDLEWLTILHSTKHLTHVDPQPKKMSTTDLRPTTEELEAMRERMAGNLLIPKNFVRTAPSYVHDPNAPPLQLCNIIPPMRASQNPQTVTFCDLLDIDDPVKLVMKMARRTFGRSDYIDNRNESTAENITSLGGITSKLATGLSICNSLMAADGAGQTGKSQGNQLRAQRAEKH